MLRKTATQLAIDGLSNPIVSSIMEPIRATCTPIFMLHRFQKQPGIGAGHNIETLRRCLNYLRANNYNVITLRSLVENVQRGARVPKRSVCFTMDDGFADQAEIGLPLFKEFNYPVTVFLATGMIDQMTWSWDYKIEFIVQNTHSTRLNIVIDDRPIKADISCPETKQILIENIILYLKTLPQPKAEQWTSKLASKLKVKLPSEIPDSHRPMTWDQVRALNSENVDFGPHTVNHNILSRMTGDTAKSEISSSKQELSAQIDNPLDVFCYPSGREMLDFDQRDKQIVKNSGFQAAVSADPGYVFSNPSKNDMYALPRFSLPDDNYYEFIQYCTWIERFKQILTGRI